MIMIQSWKARATAPTINPAKNAIAQKRYLLSLLIVPKMNSSNVTASNIPIPNPARKVTSFSRNEIRTPPRTPPTAAAISTKYTSLSSYPSFSLTNPITTTITMKKITNPIRKAVTLMYFRPKKQKMIPTAKDNPAKTYFNVLIMSLRTLVEANGQAYLELAIILIVPLL